VKELWVTLVVGIQGGEGEEGEQGKEGGLQKAEETLVALVEGIQEEVASRQMGMGAKVSRAEGS
jgi:hypothetical protein